MKPLYNYKKYSEGGVFNIASGVSGLVGSVFDATMKEKDQERAGVQALSGAAKGASAGAAAGPWGAVVGGALGAITGALGANKLKKENQRMRAFDRFQKERSTYLQSQANLAADPTQATGSINAQYFENGGSLFGKTYRAEGGSLNRLSSDTVEVSGPSHKKGGVQLPDAGAEVEGNETIKNDFVFSDKLGFAALHKPLARARGIIEKKPQTPERVNALNRIEMREQELAMKQEYFKNRFGIEA